MSKRQMISWVGLAVIGAAGCAAHVDPTEPVAAKQQTLSQSSNTTVPAVLAVPAGNRLQFFLDAEGVQIYFCKSPSLGVYAWTFDSPSATLFDKNGHVVGTHSRGPTWEFHDGSTVVGSKVAAFTADPTAIPELLLKAISHTGDGRMSDVSFIQRLDTAGGLAPSTGCDADHLTQEADVPYTATYYFYAPEEVDEG